MRFGPVPLAEAEGALLAHSQRTNGGVVRKGTRLTAEHLAALSAAGIAEVIVARLDPGDVHEDEAARRLADAVAGSGVRVDRADTGRANLFADTPGVLTVSAAAVDAFNAVDPAITLATLPAFQRVAAGKMVGTVKIIPFAAREESVTAAAARAGNGLLAVAPWRLARVAAISTTLPSLKESVIDKTLGIFARRIAEPRRSESPSERQRSPTARPPRSPRRWPTPATSHQKLCRPYFGGVDGGRTEGDVPIPEANTERARRRPYQPVGMPTSIFRATRSATHTSQARSAARPVVERPRLRPLAQGERLRLGATTAPLSRFSR